MDRDETKQYLKNWQGEMDGSEIYSRMAAIAGSAAMPCEQPCWAQVTG